MEKGNDKVRVVIITTGGTIEKTYNEYDGSLGNRESIIRRRIISELRLPYTEIDFFSILAKDSLDMDDDDRAFLAKCIERQLKKDTPILVLHGTDTMATSAEYCFKTIGQPTVPVIFTGAMMPLGFIDSDAKQNVTEALLACKLLSPGFYISFHSRIFTVPNVRKNKERATFEAF